MKKTKTESEEEGVWFFDGRKIINKPDKMSQMISMICRLWAAISLVILLGFLVSQSTVEATPNQRRRFIEPRLMADEEKDRKGAGK